MTGQLIDIDNQVVVTAEYTDPRYNDPYIEVSEERSEPVPHRYAHGGFKGTDARFSFYFPPKEQYQGRFFHNTYPMALTSDIGPFPIQFDVAQGNLGFTMDSGAYYVQTNLGGADRMAIPDPAIGGYRVNAAAAQYSRKVAAELYGEHRPWGYIFGGSGGSYQIMGAAENTSGVWDGFLPFVLGTPYSIPSCFTVRLHTLRVLREGGKFPAVMDAVNPGGSGDPYATLDEQEAAALREAELLGYPLRGWWNHETLNSGYFSFTAGLMPLKDPTYLDDFWSKPGYLGTDSKSSIREARVRHETSLIAVIHGSTPQVTFESVPDKPFADAHLHILSGAAAGKTVALGAIQGNPMGFPMSVDRAIVAQLQPGDRVRIDNGWALALQTYQRHQLPPSDEFYGWNQFRGADGAPLYPQRAELIGPASAIGVAGSLPIGNVHGKTLVLEVLMDIDALPWQADWYRSAARRCLGDAFEDNFAIWFIDNAQHDNPLTTAAHANTVSFEGALQQGLRDLAAWVETGRKPSETRYEVIDSQIHVPATAAERGGIQAVVDVEANGGIRAEVKVGEPVALTATVEVPEGAGKIVSAEWDFEGVGDYPVTAEIATPQDRIELSAAYSYARPGTYFPVLRVASQREGDPETPYGRVQNIGRARVVVE